MRVGLPRPIAVAALKSYGDFVIAVDAVRRARGRGELVPTVIAGHHLAPLASALGCDDEVRWIGDAGWTDVPAAFDVRKRGKLAATRSLFELQRQMRGARADMLLFDRLGWRERFIGVGHAVLGLPHRDNIYLAYEACLAALGYPLQAACPPTLPLFGSHAVIVPGSRLSHKVLPAQVIRQIVATLETRGLAGTVVVLEGEQVELPHGMPRKTLRRLFDELLATVASADLIVSADSLAAHLGEFVGRPAFVFTPRPNRYWLPRHAFRTQAWAEFAEIAHFGKWLDECLSRSVSPTPCVVEPASTK